MDSIETLLKTLSIKLHGQIHVRKYSELFPFKICILYRIVFPILFLHILPPPLVNGDEIPVLT